MQLTIDTLMGTGSVALFDGVDFLHQESIEESNTQASTLVSKVQACLIKADISPGKLDRIVVTVGPGGFTAIRIGLATAQALAMIHRIELIGVSTMSCMAHASQRATSGNITAILPSKRGTIFTQSFDGQTIKPITEIEQKPTQELDANQHYISLKHTKIDGLDVELNRLPDIDAKMIGEACQQQDFLSHHKRIAEPLYIRPPDAKPSKRLAS